MVKIHKNLDEISGFITYRIIQYFRIQYKCEKKRKHVKRGIVIESHVSRGEKGEGRMRKLTKSFQKRQSIASRVLCFLLVAISSARCAISSVCIRIWKARLRWWTRNRGRMRRNASFRTVWTIISKNSAAEPDKMHAPALPAPRAFLCFLGFICALQRAGLTDQRHTLILL